MFNNYRRKEQCWKAGYATQFVSITTSCSSYISETLSTSCWAFENIWRTISILVSDIFSSSILIAVVLINPVLFVHWSAEEEKKSNPVMFFSSKNLKIILPSLLEKFPLVVFSYKVQQKQMVRLDGTSLLIGANTHAFCLPLYRVGRGISCHQLVSGAGHTPGQSSVRLVEPHSWRLSVGLCSTGHLGHLWQGLCSPQDPPWQPARLLSLVRHPICRVHLHFYARC